MRVLVRSAYYQTALGVMQKAQPAQTYLFQD